MAYNYLPEFQQQVHYNIDWGVRLYYGNDVRNTTTIDLIQENVSLPLSLIFINRVSSLLFSITVEVLWIYFLHELVQLKVRKELKADRHQRPPHNYDLPRPGILLHQSQFSGMY